MNEEKRLLNYASGKREFFQDYLTPDFYKKLDKHKSCFTDLQYQIIKERFDTNLEPLATQEEIAKKNNLTKQRISAIEKRVLEKTLWEENQQAYFEYKEHYIIKKK